MGTGNFGNFGNTGGSDKTNIFEHRIDKNANSIKQKYPLTKGGYFGEKGKNSRVIKTKDPIATSYDFYLSLGKGGKMEMLDNGKGTKITFDEKTIIVHRVYTSTKDSPAIDIKSKGNSKIKSQKIHFIKGE